MTEEQKKKNVGLAIGSLVCGCLILIPLLGFLLGIVAIVLGIIALVKISHNKETLKGNGMAISGIVLGGIGVLLLPIITLLSAIAIPNLLRARVVASEQEAKAYLQSAVVAAETFCMDNQRYPESLNELIYTEPSYLPELKMPETSVQYDFKLVDTADSNTYFIKAVPSGDSYTSKSFCVVEDGIIRVDAEGSDIYGYEGCLNLEPLDSSGSKYSY